MKHTLLFVTAGLPFLLSVGTASAEDLAAAQRAKLVTSVQAALGVPVDGQMGPKTHEAIKQFQTAKHLDPSGQLDVKTLSALGLTGPKPSSAAGDSAHMQGKPSTPIGPNQPSEERAAEPKIKPARPTGQGSG
jgi:peptidoglycan hydrolase-like protein with peptidoglycan-binding domain